MSGSVAVRMPEMGGYRWTGTANGVSVTMTTEDADLQLTVEPISSERVVGVALIDQWGFVHASVLHPRTRRAQPQAAS